MKKSNTAAPAVSTESLITRSHDIIVVDTSDGDDDDATNITLDMSPESKQGYHPENAATRDELIGPEYAGKENVKDRSHGEGYNPNASHLKSTTSAKKKTRMKAVDSPKKKERHPAMIPMDEERLIRALNTDTAVKAGERLYHFAVLGNQRKLKEAAAHVDPTFPDKNCTFKPSLSAGTECLMKDSGAYRPPADRFDAQALRLAKAKLIQHHAMERIETQECTFQPRIEAVSKALVRRTRSASGVDRNLSPGPRLYEQGQDHHLKKTIVVSHIREMEDRQRVGGAKRLSKGEADSVERRLREWQRRKEHGIETLRQEVQLTLRPVRSRSVDDSTFFGNLHQGVRRSASSCANHGEREEQSPRSRQQQGAKGTSASPSKRALEQAASPQTTTTTHVSRKSLEMAHELRLIRFRALFSKFLTSTDVNNSHRGAAGPTLTLGSVRDQVRRLFPNDHGIVHALSRFKDDEAISRDVFVAALCAFEKRYGPQPWGRLEHHRLHEEDSDEDDDVHHPHRVRAPKISPISEQLAAHRNAQGLPIYQYLLRRGEETQLRIKEQQQELDEERKKELTFQPRINHLPPRHQSVERRSNEQRQAGRVSRQTPRCDTAVVKSLNTSVDSFSCPPSPTWRRGGLSSGDAEVRDLLQEIQNEIGVSSPRLVVPQTSSSRCAAPVSPSARLRNATPVAMTSAPATPISARRSPLRGVDWNVSGNSSQQQTPHQYHQQSPSSARKQTPPPPHSNGLRFASEAESFLDTIYCKVEVDKRYAKEFNKRVHGGGGKHGGRGNQQGYQGQVASHKPFR